MNTKKVCEHLSITPKALRIYEKYGLISPRRGENNYREYSLDDILQIRLILRLRQGGFPLKEISQILAKDRDEEEYQKHFYRRIREIENRIEKLEQEKENLLFILNQTINAKEFVDIQETILRSLVEFEHQRESHSEPLLEWKFDDMAKDYENRFLEGEQSYYRALSSVRGIIRGFGNRCSFLDIGCGVCTLWECFDETYDVTGLDKSLPMLMQTKEKLPWIKLVLGDIKTIKKEMIGQFDVVISLFAIHHIPREEHRAVIEKMVELYRDGGALVIIEKNYLTQEAYETELASLEQKGAGRETEILKSEFYLYTEETIKFLKYLGQDVYFHELEENIGCYIIRKQEVNHETIQSRQRLYNKNGKTIDSDQYGE